MTRLRHQLVAVVVSILVCGSVALGQRTFGAVGGTITDPSAAVIAGAQVTLTNLGTTARQITTSNEAGIYQFVNIPPGDYQIEAEKTGFRHFMRQPVVVQVQQSYRIDIPMELGAVSQTVEVKAATPLLQPQTSSLMSISGTRCSTRTRSSVTRLESRSGHSPRTNTASMLVVPCIFRAFTMVRISHSGFSVGRGLDCGRAKPMLPPCPRRLNGQVTFPTFANRAAM